MEPDAVAAIRRLFAEGSEGGIDTWLADDVELRPPTYGKSWHGKPLVSHLLRFAAASFDNLRYTDWVSRDDLHILRFEALVGGKALSGVDLVRLDDAGRITLFEIFSRPPKIALDLLVRMSEKIGESDAVRAIMEGQTPNAG
jgi:hypothetical protein